MTTATRDAAPVGPLDIRRAAVLPAADVLDALDVPSAEKGLTAEEVARRRARYGPNAVSAHRTGWPLVLWHQLRSPLLVLLLVAAAASYAVGERADAVIIGVIVTLSVGLGFVNEYRAERSAAKLHSQIRHRAVVLRGGRRAEVDVTDLVPGDVVWLTLGEIVPADVRLLEATGLECDESVITGESLPVPKSAAPVQCGTALAELSGCALMGTVVHAGAGRAVVLGTGLRTEFGKVAAGLSSHQLETEFQVGLRRFSMLLVYVAGALTGSIFVINVLLHKPVLDALLFSLAIAVGITPQLLPAVVSTSLAAGSRRLSRRKVLVKRLVCIEDLGDVDALFTDKTGTLTVGRIEYMRAVPGTGSDHDALVRAALLCTENADPDGGGVGGNPLDQALWDSPATARAQQSLGRFTRLGVLPFDHERMLVSVIARAADGPARPDHQGRAGDRPGPLPQRARGYATGRARRVRRRQSRDRRRDPSGAHHGRAGARRRARPCVVGVPGVPRPAEPRRPGFARPARPAGDHRQSGHRRQPGRRGQGLPRSGSRRERRHADGRRAHRSRRCRLGRGDSCDGRVRAGQRGGQGSYRPCATTQRRRCGVSR